MKIKVNKKVTKYVGVGLLAAAATYFAANEGPKLYDKWITEQAGKSAAKWFDTYFPTLR
jgi:hypothetical protein